ncbi:MAG: hypothetical protein SH856_13730 [Flavobacteriales bacterium]|nr:hypothetical protein [Flavobacteriales bacterium]
MKNILFIFIVFFCSHLRAQDEKIIQALTATPVIEVMEQSVDFRGQAQPAFNVFIMAEESEYERDWKNFMLVTYAVQLKKSSGYYEAYSVLIPAWHSDSINVYSKATKDGDGLRFFLHVESRGQFINSDNQPQSAAGIIALLKIQVKDFYTRYYDMLAEVQQKAYDRQVKDIERLISTGEKMNKEMANKEADIGKANQAISETNGKLKDNANHANSQKQQLDIEKKEHDNMKRELDLNVQQVNLKQKEYDQLNYSGKLNTKQGEKLTKELAKLRSEQEKIQPKITSKNEDITKTESSIFDIDEERTKLENKVHEIENSISRDQSEINNLKSQLDNNEKSKADKQLLMDNANSTLDKLRNAKAGLVVQ